MSLPKTTIEKLTQLEDEHFHYANEMREKVDALDEKWSADEYDGDIHDYIAERDALTVPFWSMACCTRMVEQNTQIRDDGLLRMTWRLEWCPESIRMFPDGIKWAIERGLEVPDEFLKEG